MAKLYAAFGLILFLLVIPACSDAAPPDCSGCHSKVMQSTHKALSCTDCHEDIKSFPHPDKIQKPSCVACHGDADKSFTTSVHKAKKLDCKSCHTVHGPPQGQKTCLSCHASPAHKNLPSSNKHVAVLGCIACHDSAKSGAVEIQLRLPKDTVIKKEEADTDKNNIIDKKEWASLQTKLSKGFGKAFEKTTKFKVKADAHSIMSKPLQCAQCHTKEGIFKEAKVSFSGKETVTVPVDPTIFVPETADMNDFQQSVHGKAGMQCTDCHQSRKKPGNDICAGCHSNAGKAFAASAHGSAGDKASCKGCHGSHSIKAAKNLTETVCATCHTTVYRLYQSGVHTIGGRTDKKGALLCADCHGTGHTILTKGDPKAPVNSANLARTCAKCHDNPELIKNHKPSGGIGSGLYVDSIHGHKSGRPGAVAAATCNSCHGSHAIKTAKDPTSTIYPANIPATCGTCHGKEQNLFASSIHGQQLKNGNRSAPSCASCHTPHRIKQVKGAEWVLEAIRECGNCHGNLLETYRHTYHGKVTNLGFTRVAKCADCHGSHSIFPQSDRRSTVSEENLLATCRQCHPKANNRFTQFKVHADYKNKTDFPLLHYVWIFMTALLFAVFGFFGLHTILWLPRSWIERIKKHRKKGQ